MKRMECFLIGMALVTADVLENPYGNQEEGESVPVVSRSAKHHERNSRKNPIPPRQIH